MNIFACIASGPSLKKEDCYFCLDAKMTTITCNSSWEMIPECAHIYAGDREWWQNNHNRIRSDATLWCGDNSTAQAFHCEYFKSPLSGTFNSGQRAILLADYLGADKIILLGYDCSIKNGIHWHGLHGNRLRNPHQGDIDRFKEEFNRILSIVDKDKIINCSRHTELEVFNKGSLEDYK